MFESIVNLISKIVDVFKSRRESKRQKEITELRIRNKELTDAAAYERAKGLAELHAQRAATNAGKNKNKEYRPTNE